MPTPIETAINNFVEQCQAIPTSLGSPGTRTAALSTNQHTLNIPYPHGITVGGPEQSSTQISQINQLLAGRPANASTAVVDSHSNLDLKPLGFEVLFGTPWSLREPTSSEVWKQSEPRIESVNTPAQLQEFDRAAAAGFGQPSADVVYSTPLLNDPRFRFQFIREGNDLVAGIQTFTNDNSIGIYTLFTLSDHRRKGFAKALVRSALATNADLPAITNPSDQSVHLFRSAGFAEVGKRTIWLKN